MSDLRTRQEFQEEVIMHPKTPRPAHSQGKIPLTKPSGTEGSSSAVTMRKERAIGKPCLEGCFGFQWLKTCLGVELVFGNNVSHSYSTILPSPVLAMVTPSCTCILI